MEYIYPQKFKAKQHRNNELFESNLVTPKSNPIHGRNFIQWTCVRYGIYLFIIANNLENSKTYIFRYSNH